MKEWFMDPANQDLLKTMLIASGFGIGFFVLKGLAVIRFPFEFLFSLMTTKITFTNSTWEGYTSYTNLSKKILNSKKWFYRSVAPVGFSSTHEYAKGNVVSPGNGWFICWLNGRIAFIKTMELNKEFGQYMVTHVIWFTRNDKKLIKLMTEIKDVKTEGLMINYLNKAGEWIYLGQRPRRNLETVFYRSEVYDNIANNYENFKNNRERNRLLGVVSKTVKLFYGPPGTGKTSIGSVLATIYNKDIYIVNTANVSDDTFIKAIYNIPDFDNAIILFEDIDNNTSLYDRSKFAQDDEIVAEGDMDDENILKGRKKVKTGERVSLNTLLNFLDGLLTPDGLDVGISTNHLEKLDPALYRESRVNLLQEIGYADGDVVKRYIEFYYNTTLTPEQIAQLSSIKPNITCSYLTELKDKGLSVEAIISKVIS